MGVLCLFETPAGFALFNVLDEGCLDDVNVRAQPRVEVPACRLLLSDAHRADLGWRCRCPPARGRCGWAGRDVAREWSGPHGGGRAGG